jgi:Flp pilus assembly protein TadB
MAQTKRKRRTKHRGNAAGMVEVRGRTSRANAAAAGSARRSGGALRTDRLDREPTWRASANRSAIATILFVVVIAVVQNPAVALAFGIPMFFLYTALGFYTDRWVYQRRMAKRQGGGTRKAKV